MHSTASNASQSTLAQLYDSSFAELRRESGDAAFYLGLAREGAGPVLELGCGTGRVLLQIAAAGFPCSGIDASPSMLAALRRKPYPPSLRLACLPMQSFDLGEDRFMLIYAAFRSFQHLLDVSDQLDCLACVRRHLAPGGIFAMDVFNPRLESLLRASDPEREDLRFDHEGEEVVRYTSVERDRVRQILRVRTRFERRGAGRVLGSESAAFDLRYFFRFELEHLLARAGFGRVSLFGDFQGAPLTADNGFVIRAQV